MISIYFAITGFIAIFFTQKLESHFSLLIPAILTIIYGILVCISLMNIQNKVLVMRRIDTINFMGFLYSIISIGTLLYKLKIFGGTAPDSLALMIALSYLSISITTSFAGLLFHSLVKRIFMKSFPINSFVWERAKSA